MHVETAARVVNSLENFVSFAKTKQKIPGRLLKNKKEVKKKEEWDKVPSFSRCFSFFRITQTHPSVPFPASFFSSIPVARSIFFLLTVVVCIRGVVWAGL